MSIEDINKLGPKEQFKVLSENCILYKVFFDLISACAEYTYK